MGLILGILIGAGAVGYFVVKTARTKMIETLQSPHSLEDTVSRLEDQIKEAGWSLLDSSRMNDNLKKHGVDFVPQVHLLKVCKAPYAAEVLREDRRMACLMPCTLAVYETDWGSVEVSKMNSELMGKVYGGVVKQVMGGAVSAELQRVLNRALAR